MKNSIITLILIVFLLGCKDDKKIEQPTDVITYENIEKHIVELADDKHKGRMPMTESEEGVINYIAGQMKEVGVEPANGDSYFQEVPIVSIRSEMSPTLDVTSKNGTIQLKQLEDYVAFTRNMQEQFTLENSEIVFVGFGITAPEYDRNDYEGVDVKGKTVIMLVNDPGFGTDSDYFKGNTMTYYGRWTYKFEEAARQGAKACFIVHENGPAGYPWAVVRSNGEGANLYLKADDNYNDRCAFEGWITQKSAKTIIEACGYDFDEVKKNSIDKNYKSFSLNATANAWLKNDIKVGKSKNVIGVVKGKKRPDESIVYTAHWDHLGVVPPVNGDSIANGATDNASAVAWMLEIARAFVANEQPDRTVVFLSPTAEEAGLIGTEYYVSHPYYSIDKTVAVINTDVIFFTGKFKDVTLTGNGHSNIDEWVEKAAEKHNRYMAADPNPENGMYFRSDHFPFVKKGVPAIFAKGYIDSEKLGKEKSLDYVNEYWKNTYHKTTDEYHPDEHDLTGLVEDAKLLYEVGFSLANSNDWPTWNKDSEFKGNR